MEQMHTQPEQKQKSEKKRKKKKRPLRKMILLLILLLLLAALLGILGAGMGWWGNPLAPAFAFIPALPSAPPAQQPEQTIQQITPAPQITPRGETDLSALVEVREDQIFYQNELVTVEALKERVLSANTEGMIWELRDNQAKKETYDQAKAALAECAVTFVES